MTCLTIDAKPLFDAIRKNKDEFWKAATIISLNIPVENRVALAKKLLHKESAQKWFILKLEEYEYGGDDYA